MTSVKEIRGAFEDIFAPEKLPFLSLPENQQLSELESTRHLLMHKGGMVDKEFRERTGLTGLPIGQPLPLNINLATHLANVAIEQGCRLLMFVQSQLGYGPPAPAA